MYKKYLRVSVLIFIGAITLLSCGQQGGGGQAVSPSVKVALQSSSVELSWPEGYRYDRETRLLLAPSGRRDNYLPSYLTNVNIKIVASGGVVWYDKDFASSDSIRLDFELDPGTYTFYGTATTTTSETYTARETHTLEAGSSTNIVFDFVLNAVPTISASGPGSVNKGQSANISVTATDEDDGDTLTITKSANGGTLSRSIAKLSALAEVVNYLTQTILSVTWTAPDNEGTYTITFTATDGHGGIAVTRVTISVVNQVPTVTITADKSTLKVGESVTFTCTGTDADFSDSGSLSLAFGGVASGGGTGGTITNSYTTSSSDGSSVTATCSATDNSGATASASVSVTVLQSIVITGSVAFDACGGIRDEWEFLVTNGSSYTATCSSSTSGADLFLRRWYFSRGWIGDGTTNLTGVNADESVSWSATTTGNYRFSVEDASGNAIQYTCTFTGTIPTNITLTGDDVNGNGC